MLKISLFFLRKTQTLRVNNSRILMIKNAKFSGYYFYMNQNISRDFQICISVPLISETKIGDNNSTHSRPVSEAVTRGVLQKKVFFKIQQNSKENTCDRVSFLIKLLAQHLCQSLFFNKVAASGLWHGCFFVNFEKFLRTPFLQNTYHLEIAAD